MAFEYKLKFEDKFRAFIILLKRSDFQNNEGVALLKLAVCLELVAEWLNSIDFDAIYDLDDLRKRLSSFLSLDNFINERMEEIDNAQSSQYNDDK